MKWIALSEDGTQLATCTLDGSVWLLPLSGEDQLGVPADSLARVLGKAGLQLTGVELSEPGGGAWSAFGRRGSVASDLALLAWESVSEQHPRRGRLNG